MNARLLINSMLEDAITELGLQKASFDILTPKGEFGDYSTNVAMVLGKQAGVNPRDLAGKIVSILDDRIKNKEDRIKLLEKIEVAGPGFINFTFSPSFFTKVASQIISEGKKWGANQVMEGKKVMVEYTDPNPFKPFHIGHLMTNAIGESIAHLVGFSGAKVVRANYQGDVGLHVAKAIWGLMQNDIPSGADITANAEFIGKSYVQGSSAYESDEKAKGEIEDINKKVYTRTDEKVNELYDWGRKITLEAFEEIYHKLGTKFDYYFFESDMAKIGTDLVNEYLGKVFEHSNGAMVFHGENFDKRLHTRVFINSKGLPTYETKELGLVMTKFKKENPDLSITVTAIEQGEYMKVVTKAIEQIDPSIASRMTHVTHGMMKLETGKMSSRLGNVVTGESLMKDAYSKVADKVRDRGYDVELQDRVANTVSVAALKYSILKPAMGNDIAFNFDQSISFDGDSGPYLQYSAIRAKAILAKAKEAGLVADATDRRGHEVTRLERMLFKFGEVVETAAKEFHPHHVVTYLTDLASAFNQFYGMGQIVDTNSELASYKLALTHSFYITMENGLAMLGINVPEKM